MYIPNLEPSAVKSRWISNKKVSKNLIARLSEKWDEMSRAKSVVNGFLSQNSINMYCISVILFYRDTFVGGHRWDSDKKTKIQQKSHDVPYEYRCHYSRETTI